MEEGSLVRLSVNLGGGRLDFATVITKAYEEPYKNNIYCIGVEPIIEDGRTISFGAHPVTVFASNKGDNREYKFVTDINGFNKDRTQMLLFSKDSVDAVNHRTAYRIPCNHKTVVQIGNNKKTINGYVHDISFSGISMNFPSDQFKSLTVGSPISISIFDNDDHVFKVNGNIVRFVEGFAENRTLLGVQFVDPPPAIAVLVTRLQRNECRLRQRIDKRKGKVNNGSG